MPLTTGRTEHVHNTPEQVRGYLVDALNLVAELDPPADLRVAAFNHAVALGPAKQIQVEQQMPPQFVPPVLGRHG